MLSVFRLSAHERAMLARDPGPPATLERLSNRVLASFVADWSVTHVAPDTFPRMGKVEWGDPPGLLLGGAKTPLLSDRRRWRMLLLPGRPTPRFSERLDCAPEFSYARVRGLADAVIALRDSIAATAQLPHLQSADEKLGLSRLAQAGNTMLPGLLAVVLADCLPRALEDRPRGTTRRADTAFRRTCAAVANVSSPPDTYTVGHLAGYGGASAFDALASVVGKEAASSGVFDIEDDPPLPTLDDVRVEAETAEEAAAPLAERFDFLNGTVQGLGEHVSTLLSHLSTYRFEAEQLRACLERRVAKIEDRAPGDGDLASREDFLAHQCLTFRVRDELGDRIASLASAPPRPGGGGGSA